jgi:DNA-binding MarR family transcriptional regulator
MDEIRDHDDRLRERVESDAFVHAFDALAQAIRRARGSQTTDGDGRPSLTFSQYALIRALADRRSARIGDLAGDAEIAPSTATRILDTLERRGLIRRDRVIEDRRAVTVTLTDLGRGALRRQDAWMQGRERAFFAALPAVERDLAPDLLVRLARLIDELAAGPGDGA